jgi:hypothetical protein
MKKIILINILTFFSVVSVAQSAGSAGAERQQRARRSSADTKLKKRKQMQHFESKKTDPNLKYNGTSYRINMFKRRKTNDDGFKNPSEKR